MILFGLVDVNRAAKGLLVSSLSLLPNIHDWGTKTAPRAFIFGTMLLASGAASLWLGPVGVISQTVKCDAARTIEFSIRTKRVPCKGAVTRNIWLSPLERNSPVRLYCFDARSNRWTGTYQKSAASSCGDRPQDAAFVTNGIEIPDHDTQSVAGIRLVKGITRIRQSLDGGALPNRKVKDRLLFATWNLRDFGTSRSGFGERMDESFAFIAEVISHFDIVAIQELTDRKALRRLLELLGDDYRAEFSFVAPGPAGNRERQGFIYDTRKVSFGDLSTAIVFDGVKGGQSRTGQPARPPFLAEFIVNKRKFFAVTAHVYFGSMAGPRFERRILELEQMARGLDRTFARNFPDHPVIFAGDMNTSTEDGREMQTLLSNGFQADLLLRRLGTQVSGDRPYDQILIRTATAAKMPIGKFGVFKPTDHVFRIADWEDYRIDMQRIMSKGALEQFGSDPQKLFERFFRTFQISDHHLKWAEFRIDW